MPSAARGEGKQVARRCCAPCRPVRPIPKLKQREVRSGSKAERAGLEQSVSRSSSASRLTAAQLVSPPRAKNRPDRQSLTVLLHVEYTPLSDRHEMPRNIVSPESSWPPFPHRNHSTRTGTAPPHALRTRPSALRPGPSPVTSDFHLVVMGRSVHWMDRVDTLTRLDRMIEPAGAVALFHDSAPAIPANGWRKVWHDICLRSLMWRWGGIGSRGSCLDRASVS